MSRLTVDSSGTHSDNEIRHTTMGLAQLAPTPVSNLAGRDSQCDRRSFGDRVDLRAHTVPGSCAAIATNE